MKLDISKIWNILHFASELFKLKENIKFLIFYEGESFYEKYQSNLRLVFNGFFKEQDTS